MGPPEILEARSLLSQVFTVTNTSDSAATTGSLRWAIGQVNADTTDTLPSPDHPALPSPDQIHFAIPTTDPAYNATTGVWTIAPATALPTINRLCIIDGSTQTGAAANTSAAADNAAIKIELDGGAAGNIKAGLKFGAGSGVGSGYFGYAIGEASGVRGLAIHSFDADVDLLDSEDFVQGCFLGVDAAGAALAGRPTRSDVGVVVEADSDLIGGTAPADRNQIANCDTGVVFDEQVDRIAGNLIGTDRTGTVAVPNVTGIVADATNGDLGSSSVASNVISGNVQYGIDLAGADVWVQGNYIGTDVTGTKPLGNGLDGIFADSGEGNVVGGTTLGAANVISANGGQADGEPTAGVDLSGTGAGSTSGNYVEGNFIGTDATGTRPLGNAGNGIRIGAGAGDSLLYNIIDFNAKIGIDLVGGTEDSFGVTANSPGGPHSGPNDLQNYPVLHSALALAGQTTITGTLNSDPYGTFQVDLYAVPTADPSGHGQAQTHLGTVDVTTDASGNTGPYSLTVAKDLLGQQITATATLLEAIVLPDMTQPNLYPVSTSEFSADIPVTASPPSADLAVIDASAAPNPVEPGGDIIYKVTIVNNGPGVAVGVVGSVQVPPDTTYEYISTSVPGVSFTPPPFGAGEGTTIALTAPVVAPGVPITFMLQVRVVQTDLGTPSGTVIASTAGVASQTPDPDPSNNFVTAATVVYSPPTTATSVTGDPSPAGLGQPVTFTALVSPQEPVLGGPGGTVTFLIDGVGHTVATFPSNGLLLGRALYTTSALGPGRHTVVARYNGYSGFAPSVSPAFYETITAPVPPPPPVQAATVIGLASTLAPSTFGQAVTFAAAVVPAALHGVPTGRIVFFVDGRAAWASPVVAAANGLGGSATFTTPALSVGTHQVVAVYSGDASFTPAVSASVAEVVVAPPRLMEVLRLGVHEQPTTLALVFSAPLDPVGALDAANYTIVGPGGQTIPVAAATLMPGNQVVVLQPLSRLNVHWTYRLIVNGTPPFGLSGASGAYLGYDPVETITIDNLVV